ncbi:MAG: hypothetical protein JWR05_3221 [Mucilaginibacter sp.]|nr:hypothetical protein [Mucilaginibacter sp.]
MSSTLSNNNKVDKVSTRTFALIFFIVIFISDDTFLFGTNDSIVFICFKYVTYLFLSVYLLAHSNLKSLVFLTRSSLILYLIIISVFITVLLNVDFRGGYVYQVLVIFLAYLISNYIPSKELVRLYIKYIYVLSIISIIVFIIASVSDSFLSFFPISVNVGNVEFYNLFVCVVFKDVGEMRNTGIFREPGVYMIYLNIAILFELFYKDKINKLHVVVFLITLFLTFSTAAFIILIFTCIAYLLKKNNREERIYTKLLIITLGVVIVCVIMLSPGIYSRIFDKIGKDSIDDGSSLARAISIYVNYHIFIDNPIAGCGITKYVNKFLSYTREYFHITTSTGNNTNMILTVFAVYGLVFGMALLYSIMRLAKKISKEFIVSGLLIVAFLMMLSNEDLRYSLMIYVFLFWGLRTDLNIKNAGAQNLNERIKYA